MRTCLSSQYRGRSALRPRRNRGYRGHGAVRGRRIVLEKRLARSLFVAIDSLDGTAPSRSRLGYRAARVSKRYPHFGESPPRRIGIAVAANPHHPRVCDINVEAQAAVERDSQ